MTERELVELAEAHREALNLAKVLHRRWYSHVPQWQPLNTVAGIISQIDNMTAGLGERIDALEVDAARLRGALAEARTWIGGYGHERAERVAAIDDALRANKDTQA